jgi:hypothetical protein
VERLFCLDQIHKKEEAILNALSMAKWRFEENIAELNKPVDKERWGMSTNGCITTHQTMRLYSQQLSYNHLLQLSS